MSDCDNTGSNCRDPTTTTTTTTTRDSEHKQKTEMGDVLTKDREDDESSEVEEDEEPVEVHQDADVVPELQTCEEVTTIGSTQSSVASETEAEAEFDADEFMQLLLGQDKIEQLANILALKDMDAGIECHPKDACIFVGCMSDKKGMPGKEMQEMMKFRRLGINLRQHIRTTFTTLMESECLTDTKVDANMFKMNKQLYYTVALLCERIPDHLFMWLVGQAQELVLEVKVCLLTLLYERSVNNLAELFLKKLLDGYDALIMTALQMSELLEPVERELFSKAKLTWEYINKSLFRRYVYCDPSVQNNLPPFISKLRKLLKTKGTKYHRLVDRFLSFEDEMTRVDSLSPEIERLIDKYNVDQKTGLAIMKKIRDDLEEFKSALNIQLCALSSINEDKVVKSVDDLDDCILQVFKTLRSKQNFGLEHAVLPNSMNIKSVFKEWNLTPHQRLANLVEALAAPENEPKESSVNILEIQNRTCDSENVCDKQCECYTCNSPEKRLSPTEKSNPDSDSEKDTEIAGQIEEVQKPESPQTQTRHSTTQTPNHVPHQGRCPTHGNSDTAKPSGPHRSHSHNNHPPASCHKQHIVYADHIKRFPGLELNFDDCSDSGSSHEDSCSTSSSTPRDPSRHCDCCYCEVFGHGLPSVAPVSRNYNEMRERLRQLLSKKKAKKCKSVCSSQPKSPAELSTNSDSKAAPNLGPRSNTPVSTSSIVPEPPRDQRNLEELLEFIEGNQTGKRDNKKAEKKIRQKQRKLEEKLKQEQKELERQKLIEFQKKTPEVTITVVDPQKPCQHKLTQRNLPEVSILPATAPIVLTALKQPNAKKKNEVSCNSTNKTKVNDNKKGSQKKGSEKAQPKAEPKVVAQPEPAEPALPDLQNLTKKERKKLKREMAKLAAAKAETQEDNRMQIVTIKRVMESNNAEPTVTITLKGQTPAEDKVLFTLVNGQTKEPDSTGKKKKKGNAQPQQNNKQQNSKQQNNSKAQNKQADGKNSKQKDKKNGKLTEEPKQNAVETKSTKKKDKKNSENKENLAQQQNQVKNNQQQNAEKKQNKVATQKPQQNNETGKKKNQNQNKNQAKAGKNPNEKKGNNVVLTKIENQKPSTKSNQSAQKQPDLLQKQSSIPSNQFKDNGAKINIENLKLPPGITITKVDAPARVLPTRTQPPPKPINPPKQTTIIAAPMSGVPSNYGNPQGAGGNVIVVDTGKLKKDLAPKSNEKEAPSKKKKKKKKNANASQSNGQSTGDQARIMHNPGTNMVTIRNPAFGPPKMEPSSQQAAIIKVSENGMVTIRSPALQQAINAGLSPPPKPDFIIKGDLSKVSPPGKSQNGILTSSLAELRSRLTQPECSSTTLSSLANIQISKVTSGQPIPESGINLKGTSVTLTKVKNAEQIAEEAKAPTGKAKKKKKRGNGTQQNGDDWNLVESVFTPKDIDLEDNEMDDVERELEAFKRFCLQSVPPPRKEKVNLNIKDIVLKKKSSTAAAAAAVIAAN